MAFLILSLMNFFKNTYLDTVAHCASEGISFIPMVTEAHSGAWGPTASKVWLKLGKALSLATGETTALETLRVRQNLGLALHRETARAIYRRFPDNFEGSGKEAAKNLLSSMNLC